MGRSRRTDHSPTKAFERPGTAGAFGYPEDPESAPDGLAPPFEKDDIPPPTARILAHPDLDADPSEPDAFVQGEAGRVVHENACQEGPVPGGLGS
jgi:hypothetical protein